MFLKVTDNFLKIFIFFIRKWIYSLFVKTSFNSSFKSITFQDCNIHITVIEGGLVIWLFYKPPLDKYQWVSLWIYDNDCTGVIQGFQKTEKKKINISELTKLSNFAFNFHLEDNVLNKLIVQNISNIKSFVIRVNVHK